MRYLLFRRYRNGTRGHLKACVQDLLRKYLATEVMFQQGSYDLNLKISTNPNKYNLRFVTSDDTICLLASLWCVGHYDKCVALIREKNKDMAAVTESIFSHSQVQKKNQLVIALIVSARTVSQDKV